MFNIFRVIIIVRNYYFIILKLSSVIKGFILYQIKQTALKSGLRHVLRLTHIIFDMDASLNKRTCIIDGSICEEIPPNFKKLIQKVSQRYLVLFFMLLTY